MENQPTEKVSMSSKDRTMEAQHLSSEEIEELTARPYQVRS